MLNKIINILFIITIISTFLLSGYHTKQDINDFAYVVAIGIDKGDTDDLKISFQLAIPSQNSSEEGSSSDSDTVIDTIESPSIESGLSLANGYISKKLNLSHCKVIVISEKIASLGISDIIYTLINNVELRPDCNVVISRSDAGEFLNKSKSEIENITAKYYEIVATSSKYTGFTSDVKISDVFDRISDTFGEASAILGAVSSQGAVEDSSSSSSQSSSSNSNSGNSDTGSSQNSSGSSSQNSDTSSNTSQSSTSGKPSADTDTIAGETSSGNSSSNEPSSKIDVVGLAVFKGDTLAR